MHLRVRHGGLLLHCDSLGSFIGQDSQILCNASDLKPDAHTRPEGRREKARAPLEHVDKTSCVYIYILASFIVGLSRAKRNNWFEKGYSCESCLM